MCVRTANTENFPERVSKIDSAVSSYINRMGDIKENFEAKSGKTVPASEGDTLAVLTAYQRKLTEKLNEKIENFHQSTYYKILFGTTQPAHVISIVTVSVVMSLFYKSATSSKSSSKDSLPSAITTIIYLVAFCIHFGSQFWMTFVSGLSLYFSLPRHAFGNVQKILFPKYFSLNAFLSAVTLISFSKLNYPWNNQRVFQEIMLVTCFLLELIVRLYAVPPLLKLITAKTAIEARVGIGQEIGYHDSGSLKNCPHYNGLHKTFRRVHLCVAVGNICTFVCTTLHMQYLAYHFISLSSCNQNIV